MTTACMVPWEVTSAMLLRWVMLSRVEGMPLALASSQVRYTHFFLLHFHLEIENMYRVSIEF